MSSRMLFVDGWTFSRHPVGTELASALSPSTQWSPIDVPHDWLIHDTHDLYASGEGWYRKTFDVDEELGTCRLSFRFEGVYMDSAVFINGKEAFVWKNGYATFEFDATAFLTPGKNEIVVRSRHQCPNSRWYSGAGIYRNVWLITRQLSHIEADGIYIAARPADGAWQVKIQTEVNQADAHTPRKLRQTVRDARGTAVATTEVTVPALSGPCGVTQTLALSDARLWGLDDPYLYSLETELLEGASVIDREVQRFGCRSIAFHPDNGFTLNGAYVKLHGVCQHHDLGCLGAAVNRAALRRQAVILKAMGVNAIRTSHNMPAVEQMEIADEMGILIVSESFDMWEKPKTEFDHARFFRDWAERDVASWVRRDRNHPSLIMWSIGNEIYDTHADERGQEITRRLMDWVYRHDSEHNAVVTIGSNYMPWENAQKCADIVKLAGYNYGEKYYAKHHEKYPDWIIYGSETSSIVQSRGVYHFPASQSMLADDDEQCSALGNSATSWGAKSVEACIADDRDASFCLGQFLWSGFDYIGEPTPYHTKNSYFGQIDTAGFPKDPYYIYQAEWTDWRKAPMVHIFPWWDFNEGQLIDIRVCSNAPRIELFFNGDSLGTREIDHQHGRKLVADWQLPWCAGILEAVAYDGTGKEIARDCISSFGDATRIVLSPDKQSLKADGEDLVFVEISMEDSNGRPVANANNRVDVSVTGKGRLVGLDNGDSTDFDQYKGTSRRLFSGKLLAVVAAKTEAGAIALEVTSPGLPTATLHLTAVTAPIVTTAATMEAIPSPVSTEIPVRKIEILTAGGTRFDAARKSIELEARLLPTNATWQDVEWRVTNDAGIDSNLATVAANGKKATVTALGDGLFRLRCTTRNGADRIRLISQMEFTVSGLGAATLDPYGFISGGLFTRSRGELGNGNERGVATPRDGESCVCFDGVDFGDYGSDEITIPLFVLDSEPFNFEIWEGLPGDDGSSLLARAIYRKPSRWNTYQEETFRLDRRLKGVTSVCFRCQRKAHIKGFSFTRLNKAFQPLSALDNNRIYGDTYTIRTDSIDGIGNNVSLEYHGMDFGGKGCTQLTICGRTPLEKNTIHVRFEGEDGEVKQLAEFQHAVDWSEQVFALEKVTGLNKVTLVFLPGCRFDLKSFRFS